MGRAQRTDVVRLAIIVPGDNLNHGEAFLENLVPAVKEERTAGEDPVLAEGHLGTKVGEEPGRDGSEVLLATEPVLVGVVTIGDGHSVAVLRGLVVAVAGPAHPVEGTVDLVRAGLAGVEVGHEEDVLAGGVAHAIDVEAVTGKGGGKDAVLDAELGGTVLVLLDLVADAVGVAGAPPVEVKGDEDIHVVAGGRVVGVAELLVRVAVDANVEGKGVDAGGLGATHIIVVVVGGRAVTHDANLNRKFQLLFDV